MRILIALDGSEPSDRMLGAVVPLIRATGGSAVLFIALNAEEAHETHFSASIRSEASPTPQGTFSGQATPWVGDRPVGLAEDRTQALERIEVSAIEYLHAAASEIEGIPCELRVDWSDDVPQAIVDAVAAVGADTIAVGTHGRSGIRRAILGSVAEAVVRRSSLPVLVVGPGVTE